MDGPGDSNWSVNLPDSTSSSCPECGAAWRDGKTCRDHFHQMLAWEWEDPRNWVVHHLMVLSYHMQHPILYSPEGLDGGKQLLVDFVERGVTPEEARRRNRDAVDSGNRGFKITARPGRQGAYERPVAWTMTTTDVIAAGIERYVESVTAWAESILVALRSSGNLQVRPVRRVVSS